MNVEVLVRFNQMKSPELANPPECDRKQSASTRVCVFPGSFGRNRNPPVCRHHLTPLRSYL